MIGRIFTTYTDLSPQIRTQVEKRRETGERISAMVQTLLIVFLALIWLISPKAEDGEHSFEAIPTLLLFYGPILVLRVYWSVKGMIREAASILLTIIDIAAITSLIFLYHIQYEVPPAVSLKSPTFIFLVLVIATRTLSLKPSIVAVSTGVAMLFWSLLTVYTLQHPETLVTRSFIEYSSSQKILIGAEVEKIIALFAIGTVLVMTVNAANSLLVSAIEATEQKKSLSMFFSDHVSELINSGQIEFTPGKGNKRMASVLFIDLRGFTKLSQELDPDETLNILCEYHSRIVPVINNNGGTVDKFLGDGILAHFGASVPSATYAADALVTIEQCIDSVQEWNRERNAKGLSPMEVNYSGAVGVVVFGATGDTNRLEMTVIGEPVNLAAKLEKFNKQLDAQATVTVKLLQHAFDQSQQPKYEFRVASKQKVPGMEKLIDVYYLPSDKSKLKRSAA